MIFEWDADKNEVLRRSRGITFEEIVIAIQDGGLVRRLTHPNSERYGNQELLLVCIDSYIYVVPAIPSQHGYFLKTIYKSRKYTKILLGGT